MRAVWALGCGGDVWGWEIKRISNSRGEGGVGGEGSQDRATTTGGGSGMLSSEFFTTLGQNQ